MNQEVPPDEVLHIAKLPSGREIALREISGQDELNALSEVGEDAEGMRGRALFTQACVLRAIARIDGKPFNAASETAETIRRQFSSKEWRCVQDLYDRIHFPDKGELDSFRSSIRIGG